VIRRLAGALTAVVAAAGLFAASASAHARVSPAVSLAGELQLYSLAVPTEKSGATTTRIVLTVPKNFSIDSFAPSPGWNRTLQQFRVYGSAVVQRVIWSGGRIPTGEDSLFQFLGQPASPGTYTFQVQQTYSDGSIVNWAGSESSDAPAPTIEAKSSLGGGSTPVATIIAIILGALGVILAVAALITRGGGKRELA
jgi:uncharacterized protein YcnI